jgi:hypothetical protein
MFIDAGMGETKLTAVEEETLFIKVMAKQK